MRRREFALVCLGIAAIYVPLSLFPAPDIRIFLSPWLRHIEQAGPIAAFAHPFSNYSPPYLYLLSLASLLHLPELAAIKLLSIAGICWLAWCVSRLAAAFDRDPLPAAAITFLLPTVILNGPVLGQCDTIWAGCCVLAVAEALKNRASKMAVWAGIGFAFKAQAAFLVPFCLAFVIRKRAWAVMLIPPSMYLAAILPAAFAGWPLADLLTIYAHQAAHPSLLSYAPNLWAIPTSLYLFDLAQGLAFVAAASAAIAAAGYVILVARGDGDLSPLDAALLSALLIPYLLPNMHERYFFLGEVLAFTAAYVRRDRISLVVAVLVQFGSLLSIIGYVWFLFGSLMAERLLNAVGSLAMTAAIFISAAIVLASSGLARQRDRKPHMKGNSEAGGIL
jgi:Gpi18-like mannosyltransferase